MSIDGFINFSILLIGNQLIIVVSALILALFVTALVGMETFADFLAFCQSRWKAVTCFLVAANVITVFLGVDPWTLMVPKK